MTIKQTVDAVEKVTLQPEYNVNIFQMRFCELVRGCDNNPKQVAFDADISISAVYNYMSGRIPTTRALLKLARAYNKSMDWFFTPEPLVLVKPKEHHPEG